MSLSPLVVFIIIIFSVVAILGIRAGGKEEKVALKEIRLYFGHVGKRKAYLAKSKAVRAVYEMLGNEDDIDDITWEDLKLDEIYTLLNHSESCAGEQYLYYRLRHVACREGEYISPGVWLDEKEKAYAFLLAARRLGHLKNQTLKEFLDTMSEHPGVNTLWYILLDLFMVASFIYMIFVPSYGVVMFLGSVFISVIHGSLAHRDLSPYLSGMAFVRRLSDATRISLGILPKAYNKIRTDLEKYLSGFNAFYRVSSVLGAGDGSMSFGAVEVLMSYVRMLTGIDVFAFSASARELNKIKDDVMDAFLLFGKIESDVSAASFRLWLGEKGCVPEFEEGAPLQIKNLFHPLLENPVSNDITTDGCVLLTGANASGKSTFLRALALATILGQTMGTVPAGSYKAQRFRVMSSMTVSDDLLKGDSYYVAEVKAVKRILDAAGKEGSRAAGGESVNADSGSRAAGGESVTADSGSRAASTKEKYRLMCFLDEVLRGTNTPERISAGTSILRYLSDRGVLCFAATHDLEMTQLLSGVYEDYYFSELAGEDSFTFEYKIRPGVSRERNAIRLLSIMGFDTEVTDRAGQMAEHFIETGKWEKEVPAG
ncbi:MAG: hypothetical protein K6E33_00655 [Lachnospiraceae bacterium]|nr:hypothetical protein [Lachnospiraceae bacterium]